MTFLRTRLRYHVGSRSPLSPASESDPTLALHGDEFKADAIAELIQGPHESSMAAPLSSRIAGGAIENASE